MKGLINSNQRMVKLPWQRVMVCYLNIGMQYGRSRSITNITHPSFFNKKKKNLSKVEQLHSFSA